MSDESTLRGRIAPHYRTTPVQCACGHRDNGAPEEFADHIVQAAGVEREVAAARAEAWDEGWRIGASGRNMRNPYRAALEAATEG